MGHDLGNGKSAFLKQLAVRLHAGGRRVFFVDTKLPDVFGEIENAIASDELIAFLVDDVVRYPQVVKFIGSRINNTVLLVCTTRGDQDAEYERISIDIGGAHRFIDLNVLDDDEVNAWDILLERWGYWELKAGLSDELRRDFLISDCGRENRSIILSLFERSSVASRIDQLARFFLKRNSSNSEAFCGLLISSLAQRHVSWASLVAWLNIDEDSLKRDIAQDEISFLFSKGRSWNFLTSAQLAEFILRNFFVNEDRDILVKVYSKIVLNTAQSADDARYGHDFRDNLKELMKFRFLEKMFGESDESGILIGRVYGQLSDAKRIRGNPQFWLQYAMSRIKVGDLINAESFLNTAFGRVDALDYEYNTFQLRDQRARLYFRKNAESKIVSEKEIKTAIGDLTDLAKDQAADIVYTMRSLPLIEEFLENKVDVVSAEIVEKIKEFVSLGKKTMGFERLPRSQRGETATLRKALRNVELILFNAT